MAVGTMDWLCFPNASEYPTRVDGAESSSPEIVRVSSAAACVMAEALAEGIVYLDIWTSRGHSSVTVEAALADSFVLKEGTTGDGHVLGPEPADPFAFGSFWLVEWRSGSRPLRGLVEDGFRLTDASVAKLSVSVKLPYFEDLGGIQITLSRLGPGTTQFFWNEVPGPVLAVE